MARYNDLLQETANGFRAELPPMRRKRAIAFLAVFISFSASCVFFAAKRSEGWSVAYFILLGLILVGFGFASLFGELFGTEVIEWNSCVLRVLDRTFGFSRKREFDVTLMENLRFGSRHTGRVIRM